MKKRALLISTAGIAAGLIYALESKRRSRASANNEAPNEGLSRNEPAAASSATQPSSVEQSEPSASMARIKNGKARLSEDESLHEVDDRGTNQADAAHILREIRDQVFEANNEKLALALGRPTEEVEAWANGNGLIDGDVVMKARALARQRGLEIE